MAIFNSYVKLPEGIPQFSRWVVLPWHHGDRGCCPGPREVPAVVLATPFRQAELREFVDATVDGPLRNPNAPVHRWKVYPIIYSWFIPSQAMQDVAAIHSMFSMLIP